MASKSTRFSSVDDKNASLLELALVKSSLAFKLSEQRAARAALLESKHRTLIETAPLIYNWLTSSSSPSSSSLHASSSAPASSGEVVVKNTHDVKYQHAGILGVELAPAPPVGVGVGVGAAAAPSLTRTTQKRATRSCANTQIKSAKAKAKEDATTKASNAKKRALPFSEFTLPAPFRQLAESIKRKKSEEAAGARPPPYEHIWRNRYADDIARPTLADDDAPTCSCAVGKPGCASKKSDSHCANVATCVECTPGHCPLGDDKCCNMRLQRRQYAQGLRLKDTKLPDKGWGVYASRAVEAGMLLTEYVGEVVSERCAAHRLRDEYQSEAHHYIMSLADGCVVDATRAANTARFINHSCDPNAETQKWNVGGETRIGIFALREILPGEEVTYDYRMQSFGGWQQMCRCGARNCRGWLGASAASSSSAPPPPPPRGLASTPPCTPPPPPPPPLPDSAPKVRGGRTVHKLDAAPNVGRASKVERAPKVEPEKPDDNDEAMAMALFRELNGLRRGM